MYTWTVNKPLPTVQIVSGPPPATTATSATFGVAVDMAVNGFLCVLDGGAPFACGDPPRLNSLTEGTHTLRVRGVDAIAGNGPGPESNAYTWTVDLTGPETQITEAPEARTTDPGAVFQFTSPEAGATFQCRLDNGAFAACDSPFTLTRLEPGLHTFSVRARDAAGNVDASPATRTWRVLEDDDPPNLRLILVNARNPVLARNGVLRVTLRCNERCRAQARFRLTLPPLRPGGKARVFKYDSLNLNLRANQTVQIRFKLNGLQLAALRRALRTGRTVRVNITAVATDRSGNRSVAPAGITLTRRAL